jgi:hypothetical protein
MRKIFAKRLAAAMKANGATKRDIAAAYLADTYVGNMTAAEEKVKALLSGQSSTVLMTISIYDVIACSKACNCSADFLLGLSERIN